jgi:hypothetical protein
MWLLCGCYSGHPCPLLDTGLVRPDRGDSSGYSKRFLGPRSDSPLFGRIAVVGPTGGSESLVSCLIGLEKLLSLHVTDWNHCFLIAFPFFFPRKAFFVGGLIFLFRHVRFPLFLCFRSGSKKIGFRMLSNFFQSGDGGDARERQKIPSGVSIRFCVLVPRESGRGREPDRQVDPLERKCLSFSFLVRS